MVAVSSDESGLPPHDLDLERAALGSIFLDPKSAGVVGDLLLPEHFYSPGHRAIFKTILEISDSGSAVDPVTVADQLMRAGELEIVGGLRYLAQLEEYVYAPENLPQYADKIRDMARLRRLMETAEQIREEAQSSPRSAAEILDQSEKLIFDLTQEKEARDFIRVDDIAGETIEEIEARFHNRQEVTGVPTGYPELDQLLTGLHSKDLIILAARPSRGKTAFALNVASNVVLKSSTPVGVFSLEMSAPQLVQRVLCGMGEGVSLQRVRRGVLNRQELERLDEHARILSNAPLYIDDTPALSVLEVRAKARRLKARVPDLGLLIIDYLQLMRGHGRVESRQQEVAEISRSLKALARELDLPILALSQLSRGIEQRKGADKEPKLSDLRESGAIEQDADVVMFVHRELTPREDGDSGEGRQRQIDPAQIIIGKQRNGPLGRVDLLFLGELTRFVNIHPDAGI